MKTKKKLSTIGFVNRVKISKGENEITIYKNLDNSIWFVGNNNTETTINLNVSSFDYQEFKTYHIFYDLMKNIIGRYILQDYKPYYNGLPKDFIDIENNIIICHTDSEPTSFLKMKLDDSNLSISIVKEKYLDSNIIENAVEIISCQSQYGNYYNDFSNFYDKLHKYSHTIKKDKPKIYKKTIKKSS